MRICWLYGLLCYNTLQTFPLLVKVNVCRIMRSQISPKPPLSNVASTLLTRLINHEWKYSWIHIKYNIYILMLYVSEQRNLHCSGPGISRENHDDVIKWKHFLRNWPLCGEFTGPGEFPAQRPVTRSFDVFFDLRLNKRFSKQSWGWWFETLSRPVWRHCNVWQYHGY